MSIICGQTSADGELVIHMRKHFSKCLLLGSAWGIAEATLGYLLHRFALGIGWLFWFPVAYFFIAKCWRWTKSPMAVMATALIAASLKFVDLFFPVRIDMVINPAASIIAEALSAALVYAYVSKRRAEASPLLEIAEVVMISSLWRIIYISYVLCLPSSLIAISPVADPVSFAKFLFLENSANILLICFISFSVSSLRGKFASASPRGLGRFVRPLLSVIIFSAAVLIQIAVK
jgi:hypothetical protein